MIYNCIDNNNIIIEYNIWWGLHVKNACESVWEFVDEAIEEGLLVEAMTI